MMEMVKVRIITCNNLDSNLDLLTSFSDIFLCFHFQIALPIERKIEKLPLWAIHFAKLVLNPSCNF